MEQNTFPYRDIVRSQPMIHREYMQLNIVHRINHSYRRGIEVCRESGINMIANEKGRLKVGRKMKTC